jgi:hypothetical protein
MKQIMQSVISDLSVNPPHACNAWQRLKRSCRNSVKRTFDIDDDVYPLQAFHAWPTCVCRVHAVVVCSRQTAAIIVAAAAACFRQFD